MKTHKTPNKYNIFQQYYLLKNGEKLTYNEAVNLFHKMDSTTKIEFNEFYRDEVGYEVIDGVNPYSTTTGSNVKRKLRDVSPVLDDDGNPKKRPVKKKVKQADGTYKYQSVDSDGNPFMETVWEHSSSAVTQNALRTAYNIKAHAVRCGISLENSDWLEYSAEEILQMEDNGVDIPSDIKDLAHTIIESSGVTYMTNGSDENEGEGEPTTEREAFLELIPKTEKHIEKCNDKKEKIDEKIEDMLNQNKNERKTFFEKQKSQLEKFEEYEEKLREWRRLQDKINNGEELTDSEARKYAEITGMLEDRNNSDDFKFNKNRIAMSLNEINILSVLGEKLAGETIEMGETLADYTSDYNYKSTKSAITGEIGFLRAVVAMVMGKAVAKDAVRVGTETKNFTEDTTQTINDIAQILGVESMIANPPAGESEATNEPSDAKVAENEVQMGTNDDKSDIHEDTEKTKQKDSAEKKNTTQEDDFLINDDNVLQLIDEAGEIHSELAKEAKDAVIAISTAKNDKEYIKNVEKLIDKMVAEYQTEEAQRQEIIQTKEQENKDAQDRIEELGGADENDDVQDDDDKVKDENNKQNEANKKEIDEKKQLIAKNNSDIDAVKQETIAATAKFKNETDPVKEEIKEKFPQETENSLKDTKYRDEIIPEYSQKLTFTEKSGNTLYRMGKYRITVGYEMLARMMFKAAYHHIEKGTRSSQIGAHARTVGLIPTDDTALKIVTESTTLENDALEGLNTVDTKITSITGEDTEAEKAKNAEDDQGEDENNTVNGEGGEEAGKSEEIAESVVADEAADINSAVSMDIVENIENEEASNDSNDENSNESKSEFDNNGSSSSNETVAAASMNTQEIGSQTDNAQGSSKKKEKKEMSTDEAGSSVKDITRSAKGTAKDSEQVKKDTEKDEKQLDKEAKRLQKQMKKDEKDIIRMTKESLRAAKKQTEILAKYEELVTENDELVAQEEQKQVSAPSQIAAQQETSMAASTIAQPTDSSQGSSADNAQKLQENDMQIAVLNTQFNMQGNKITRNRAKITKLQKKTKVSNKKVQAKTKIRQTKIKEAEKKEADKQQKLSKQLGTVGVAENIFSITASTGAILMLSPWTYAVGAVMFKIGTYGVIACGVAKAGINFANGNVSAALIGLGQTAISAAAAMTGTGAAAGGVMGAVTSGLQVVASSAELVNNVRAVQGKEASDVFSKIGTIAGIASSVATAGSGLSNLKGASFGQVATAVGTAAGTTLSAASQIMSEFNLGDQEMAQLLGTIGGAVSMASSIATMATAKKNEVDNKNNNEEKDNIKNNNSENNKQSRAEQKRNGKEAVNDGKKPDKQLENPSDNKQSDKQVGKSSDSKQSDNKQPDAQTVKPTENNKTDQQTNKSDDNKNSDNKTQKNDDKKQPESKSVADKNKDTEVKADDKKQDKVKAKETEKDVKKAINGEVSVSNALDNTLNYSNGDNTSAIKNVTKVVDNSSINNENKMDALKHQNVNNAENQIVFENLKQEAPEALKTNDKKVDINSPEVKEIADMTNIARKLEAVDVSEIKPSSILKSDAQIKAELEDHFNSPEMQDKLNELTEKIQTQQLEQYKKEQAKQKRNEKASEILNAIGAVTQTVPTVLEMFGSDDDTEEIKRAYASSGKEYLTGHHTFHSEQVKEDYRKKAKKLIKRVNALSGARNVR